MLAAGYRWRKTGEKLKGDIYLNLWRRPWPLGVGAVALVITNIFMFSYARALGVFPQIAMWGSALYSFLGLPTESPFKPYPVKPPYLDMHSMIDVGIILGALAAAMLASEFKLRKESWQGGLQGLLGGILMGFGTVLMPPCNVGGFWVATMAFSLSGPLAALGLLPGAYIGGRILQWQVQRAVAGIDFSLAPEARPVPARGNSRQPIIGLAVLVTIAGTAGLYLGLGMNKVGVLLLFGTAFGIIVQRSRLCFVAAFRDIFTLRDGTVMKWVLLTLAIGAVGFAILKGQGYQPEHMVFPAGLHNVVGGFIFGIGMTLAGGCGLGILARSGEGYVRSWLAILGGMLSSGAWVHIYGRKVGEGWLYGKPVFLPAYLGWGGALGLVFAFILAFYLLILWVEAGKNAKAQSG
ncbi:MAG: hypothetical protein D9V47_02690 [Clostridia bacterium]|nr:MAG: hypothetical protein D9V47_02690 [Clostridia bacterium]